MNVLEDMAQIVELVLVAGPPRTSVLVTALPGSSVGSLAIMIKTDGTSIFITRSQIAILGISYICISLYYSYQNMMIDFLMGLYLLSKLYPAILKGISFSEVAGYCNEAESISSKWKVKCDEVRRGKQMLRLSDYYKKNKARVIWSFLQFCLSVLVSSRIDELAAQPGCRHCRPARRFPGCREQSDCLVQRDLQPATSTPTTSSGWSRGHTPQPTHNNIGKFHHRILVYLQNIG